MNRTITVDPSTLLGDVLDELAMEGDPITIERGRQRAVVVDAQVYDAMTQLGALAALDAIHAHNINSDPIEIEQEIAEVVADVRRNRTTD